MRILISAILWLCVCETQPQPCPSYFLLVRIWSKAASKSGRSCYFFLSLSGNREAVQSCLSLELIQKLAVSAKCKYNKSITVCLSAMQNDNERFPDCSCITEHPELDYHLKATELILVLFFMLPLTGKNYTFHIFVVALEIYP